MKTNDLDTILGEVARATHKFPTWPTDPIHALAVLHEEVGELSKEVLQGVYEPHKTTPATIREEAIQTAAMAIRFIASLDAYVYAPGHQHQQTPVPAFATEMDPRVLGVRSGTDEEDAEAEEEKLLS